VYHPIGDCRERTRAFVRALGAELKARLKGKRIAADSEGVSVRARLLLL
jgi:hypothetical protein